MAELKATVEGLNRTRSDAATHLAGEPAKRLLTPIAVGLVLMAAAVGGALVALSPHRKVDGDVELKAALTKSDKARQEAETRIAELTSALSKSEKAREDAETKADQSIASLGKSEQARQLADAKAADAEKARQAVMVKADDADKARQAAEAKAADSERARKTADAKAADSEKAQQAAEAKVADLEKARQAAEAKAAQPPPASPETDCDRLAGGVSIEQISVASALVACNAAVSKYPDVARFSYELGRVLLAAKKTDEAKRSFEKAAATGYVPAMLSVATVYREGGDYADARRWWEKAAATGETTAMIDIGISYTTGRFIPRDYAQARRWFQKALAAGSANAKDLLDKLPSK
jgi:TPR repeat protein